MIFPSDEVGQSVGFAARKYGMAEAHDIVAVTLDEVGPAMRVLFAERHNVAEGAGAAALAAHSSATVGKAARSACL